MIFCSEKKIKTLIIKEGYILDHLKGYPSLIINVLIFFSEQNIIDRNTHAYEYSFDSNHESIMASPRQDESLKMFIKQYKSNTLEKWKWEKEKKEEEINKNHQGS
jgi:hypothetical protein